MKEMMQKQNTFNSKDKMMNKQTATQSPAAMRNPSSVHKSCRFLFLFLFSVCFFSPVPQNGDTVISPSTIYRVITKVPNSSTSYSQSQREESKAAEINFPLENNKKNRIPCRVGLRHSFT